MAKLQMNAQVDNICEKPSVSERLTHAIPLFLIIFIFSFCLYITIHAQNLFVNLRTTAALPTVWLMQVHELILEYWFLWGPFIFILMWLYFAIGCKTKKRMKVVLIFSIKVSALYFGFVAGLYIYPLLILIKNASDG